MPKHLSTGAQATDECEVEHSILVYLQAHPRAADTLRGIANWWLPRQRYETDLLRIERALGAMVGKGLLQRESLPDGEVLYTLNPRPP